jgi:hypothetical protein
MDTTNEALLAAWNDIEEAQIAFPNMCITEGRHEHRGLWTVEVDGCTYAVGTDEESDAACKDYISESVWAFRASFLLQHMGGGRRLLPLEAALEEYQAKHCEGCNAELLDAIPDFEAFVSEAVSADGRGHFLASYDGEEIELGRDANGLYVYAYRID